jgi:hypothetical protein
MAEPATGINNLYEENTCEEIMFSDNVDIVIKYQDSRG